MLRDISSIANAYGGDLLIGVDENVNGAAITLMGIEKAEDESQRIIGSCLSNIAERRQDILEEIGDVPYYVVSVTPLFVNAESIDIRDITLRNLLDTLPPFGGNSLLTLWSAPAQPTLYGLKIQPIKRGPQP